MAFKYSRAAHRTGFFSPNMILSPINTICWSSDWWHADVLHLQSFVLMGLKRLMLSHTHGPITRLSETLDNISSLDLKRTRGGGGRSWKGIYQTLCVCVFTRGVPSPDYTAWHPQKPKDSRSCKLNGGTWPSWRLLYSPYSRIKYVSPSVYAVRKVCQHLKYF